MKNQYAMIYDGHDWTLVMKDYLIDKLYDDKREYIEENLDEFINSLSDSQLSALYRWLNAADGHSYIKNIKNDIKLLLYNKRKLPMNNKINNQQEAEIMNILNALENLEPVESEENTESKVIKKPKLKFSEALRLYRDNLEDASNDSFNDIFNDTSSNETLYDISDNITNKKEYSLGSSNNRSIIDKLSTQSKNMQIVETQSTKKVVAPRNGRKRKVIAVRNN